MSLEPPPRLVDKFVNIWRDWLYFFWDLVNDHTGGAAPTPPATGTSWNAHGNTATGDATNYLHVDKGTFVVGIDNVNDTPVGNTPDFFEIDVGAGFSGAVTAMSFIPGRSAFRVGTLTSTKGGFQGSWADAEIGTNSIGIGKNVWVPSTGGIGIGDTISSIGGIQLLNLGTGLTNEGTDSVLVGNSLEAGSLASGSLCLGISSTINQTSSIGIGVFVQASALRSVCIGVGISASNRLLNNVSNSIYMGIASDVPTLIMKNLSPGVVGSTSSIGIIELDPKSTLDVGGSVGYKYSIITGTSHTVGATEDELTFIIKPTDNFTFTLPPISGIDRRMYHIKNTATQLRTVSVTPDGGGDFIDSGIIGVVPSATPLAVGRGDSIQLVADGTTSPATWWII